MSFIPAVSSLGLCDWVCLTVSLWLDCVKLSFADMPTEGDEQIQAAAQKLRDQGVDLVIAKLGTKGSMLIQKEEVLQQGIIKLTKYAFRGKLLFTNPQANTLSVIHVGLLTPLGLAV